MATPIDTACPSCATVLRVPAEFAGKKVKCKKCEAVFPVPVAAKPLPAEFAKPGAAPPVTAKPAKPVAKPAAPPPPVENDALKFAEDDEDDANPYTAVQESDAPRCPHCAKDLDPPDSLICLNCGYDLRERKRKESRNVIQHTFGDYFVHHIGAIACVLTIIGLFTGGIICWLNMADWMAGSFLETGEKDATTQQATFYVKPWCFSLWIMMFVLWASWKLGKFAFKRFFINPTPPEKVIKKVTD
jgi:predicted Zn finger-like uncharacterized protein